jgi:RHS repeat-associated protein
MTKYYYAAGQRIAMRDNGTLYYLFGDHLGSTSVSYRASDGQTTRQLYKPWGEPRYASGSLPTDYTYTGQYSYADDIATPTVTEGFGLLFYQARFYDPLLARFLSADSVVPGAYNPLAFDRYAYVFNSPLNYVDPSGHLTCGSNSHIAEDDCDPIGAPPDFDPGKYKDSYERGIKFVIWLRFHEGWWSKYMKDSATVWKFQVALAYSWETNGVLNKQFLKNMGKAFDNKLGHFTAQFGLAGYYIFLGSMQTVRTYTGKNITEPAKLKQAFAYTEEVWDGKWSMGPDDPYDFANPMPGKHKPEFLEKLNLCATTYGQNCTITKWNKMNTGFDLLNILVSPKKNGDGYSIALIVSYQQNQNIWISK